MQGEEIVFVKESARLRDDDSKKLVGMCYHKNEGCYDANVKTCIEVAQRFKHKPCKHCFPPTKDIAETKSL